MDQIIEFKDLEVGQRVKARGKLSEDGVFVAHEIRLEGPANQTEIEGLIRSVDHQKNTLRLLNREFALPDGIAVKDLQGNTIGLTKLKAGDMVQFKGRYSETEGFVSEQIRMKETTDFDFAELRGEITNIDQESKTLNVVGFTVVVNENGTILSKRQMRYCTALNDLDRKLEKYLDYNNGFFIEAGANDGVKQSNTYYFEKIRGWRGILIEPIPHLANICRLNRPYSMVEEVALVSPDYLEKNNSIDMYYCDLMSLVKGAMCDDEKDLQHVKSGQEVQNISSYELVVKVDTLNNILAKHYTSQIDLLSLDVEGYELEALSGLDFQRYRPKYMLIEVWDHNQVKIHDYVKDYYPEYEKLSYHDMLYVLKK